MRLLTLLFALALSLPALAAPPAPLPPGRIAVPGPQGGLGLAPVYLSEDWSKPLPGITRAVIVMHGLSRNADDYFAAGLAAQKAAGAGGASSLIIAPRILDTQDVRELRAAPDMLRWRHGNWAGGDTAEGPVPASSFAVFDAIIARLADRTLFPNLHEIVVAGHSAGGQVVQRYAAVGHDNPRLAQEGIGLRYVVANPSTYVWFTPGRPEPTASCPAYNSWKYGFAGRLPAYIHGDAAGLERHYWSLDITYLLGTLDTDPNHPALDKTCQAETQGPTRYARGHAYFAMLQAQAGAALHQREFDVPGVGHDGGRMFNSACGLAALFETPGCPKD
jgi:pimeloyl-ACP methyl ester carboxylesterase